MNTFATLPEPAEARSLDDLIDVLRRLKVWAGDPSYETIKDRVNAAWTAAGRPAGDHTRKATVADCFKAGRRRLNNDLVVAVVGALHPDVGYVAQWRQALRVVSGEIEAVSQVRVQGELPQDLAGFAGRTAELDQLADALRHTAQAGEAVVISAIEGMAGVGKTQLAVHAGHLLSRQHAFDQVLFVNLRGFHPDPDQPPADPAAVLDGFLRLLGMPGHQIPHDPAARVAAYRDRLAGTRALVVLDNAATADQIRPLLPATPGCLTLITSRHSLAELQPAARLTVDVFTPAEAGTYLTGALPGVPVGGDPGAAARIALRCGYLPLALGLIIGHIRATPGWTLSDHADRLDDRRRRLDSGVELALALSYQHLSADQQRLLRLASLHPGQELDAFAAAALAGTDLDTARHRLDDLCADHLLQRAAPGRYVYHDLVRAFATGRAHDHDRPAERRAALTRLFDHCLATAAAAMNTLYPAEAHRRPQVPAAGTPAPDLADPDAARAWLDTERPTLVVVAGHSATQGWPGHATRLSRTLFRYLTGGYRTEALTVHRHALDAARLSDDALGQAHALSDLGIAYLEMEQADQADEHFRRSLDLFRRIGDPTGQARVLYNLGAHAWRRARFSAAIGHLEQALTMFRQAGDRTGEGNTLSMLALVLARLGRSAETIEVSRQALVLARQTGNRHGEAYALNVLGDAELSSGRYEPAEDHLHQCLALRRQLGHRTGEGSALESLGLLHARTGRFDRAAVHLDQALTIFRETEDQDGETSALNGLGELAHRAGRDADALVHHVAAHTTAVDVDRRDQEARASAGLGHAHRALGDHGRAREHYQRAMTVYAELGMPEAEQMRGRLAELDEAG